MEQGRKMVLSPFVPSLFCCLPNQTPTDEGEGEQQCDADSALLCSADDKNEIRGSHIDNPDAEGGHK